ncbi:hypothetical protein ASD47_17485 [Caulobacter sp. Root1472]|nr:hypothetical protein ASD47_17485 [Caulobacter sp. Root1472]
MTRYLAGMDRPLDSDQLGKKGEKAFEGYCIDAGLVPNPSTWDRKGWDLVVDWREAGSAGSHDKQPSPKSCLVQVKTVWTESRSIRVRLSSIAHLAQDLKPAFVVVLKVRQDLTIAKAGIAHLEGDFLAHVLKALREASVTEKATNTIEVSFGIAKWFSPLAPDAAAVRQTLETAIGPSMETYAMRKQTQLRDLGFDDVRLVLKGKLIAPDNEAIIDGFLGLRTLDFTDVAAIETRFGIALPIEDFGEAGTFEFAMEPADSCRLLIRHPDRPSPFSLPGQMVIPPKQLFAPGRGKMLIRTDHFALTLDGQIGADAEKIDFKVGLTVEAGLPDKLLSVADWPEIYGFLAALTGQAPRRLEIHPDTLPGSVGGTVGLDVGEAAAGRLGRAAALAIAAREVFSRAGRPSTILPFRALDAARRPIQDLGNLLCDPGRIIPLKIETDLATGFDPTEVVALHCCHHFKVAEHLVAYVVLAEMVGTQSGDRIEWRSRDLKVIDVSCLRPSRETFEAYVEGALNRLAAVSYYIAPYDETADLLGAEASERGPHVPDPPADT